LKDNTVRQLHLPIDSVQQMLDADENGDQRWLDWLESCHKKLEQKERDEHDIEVVRQAELKHRLSNIPPHIQNIDEIEIEDLLP
jgi:hypothetical protein